MFTGKKIRLTSIKKGDLSTYRVWNGVEAFGRYYNAFPIREESEKNAEKLIEEHSDKTFRFAIRPIGSEDFLGVCAIEDIIWPHRIGWVSIALGPDYHSKGYGKETMQLLLNYAFNEVNLHRVQLSVFSYNAGAIKLYESLGFTHEGTFREWMQRDGRRHDMHLYGMLASEYRK